MPHSEELADRVRQTLTERDVSWDELNMFGGLAFMVRGHMTVGIMGDELMVRVGRDAHDEAVAEPHARPMDFTGRPMAGFLYVAAAGLAHDADLGAWTDRALAFTSTLPAKSAAGRRST